MTIIKIVKILGISFQNVELSYKLAVQQTGFINIQREDKMMPKEEDKMKPFRQLPLERLY